MVFSGKNIIAGFVMILVLVVSVFLVYDLLKKPSLNPIDAIPVDAQILILSKHPDKLLDTYAVSPIFKENNKKLKQIAGVWRQLDSLIQNNVLFDECLTNTESCISMHALEGMKTGVLAAISEENGFESSSVKNYLSKNYSDGCVISRTEDDHKIYAIVFSNFEAVLYLSDIQGVVLLSFEKELINRAYDHVLSETKSLSLQKGFQKVNESTRAKSDASIYINYAHAFELPQTYVQKDYKSEIGFFNSFASWSELDLTAKPDKLLLSGYTYIDDSASNYLSVIKGQTPQSILSSTVVPADLTFFLSIAIGNANAYIDSYQTYQLESNSTYSQEILTQLQDKYDYKPKQDLALWLGNEAFLGATDKGLLYSLHLKDKELAKAKLEQWAQKSRVNTIAVKHSSFVIGSIEIPDLLYPVFGTLAEKGNYYYTIIDDFVVFSTKLDVLKDVINQYNSGDVLDKNAEYLKLSESLAREANLTVCVFNPGFVNGFMHQEFIELILANTWITKFGGLGIQFIDKGEFVFTSLYTEFESLAKTSPVYTNTIPKAIEQPTIESPAQTPDKPIAAQKHEDGVRLEKNAYRKPVIVESHKSSKDCYISFDEGGKIYYFDNKNKLLWDLQLDGVPLSEVYEVDALRNGKVQYLFNTSKKIYLLDVKGNHVKGFPVKVPSGAAGPITLFDYSNNRSYRILVGSNDNRVYNFDISGKQVKGWKTPKSLAPIVSQASHLVFNKKDHLIFPDQNGNVLITDRKGNRRIKVQEDLKNNLKSDFWLNKTNNKGNVLTTDIEGRLSYIASNGQIKNTVFGSFSPDHYFIYDDFSRDGNKDFIYVDQNNLKVMDRFKKILLEYTFENKIQIKPQVFRMGTRLILAVTDSIAAKVYFFDKNGLMSANSGITADAQVELGTIASGKWEVISTYENMVIRTPWK
ncbi:MAG: DUF3352 domain-containing protein [Bacteroidales bacterium]|nr:DUF3352 domain-containing protein [Bacteroidales bacterium]